MKNYAITLLLLLAICWIFPSCEKDVYDVNPTMEAYYMESTNLQKVTVDSVQLFSQKVDRFTKAYPLALEHAKYPAIRENIKIASIRITIDIDTTWIGTDSISF